MPDYVGILKRSISALPEKDPAMRQAVYERARGALARQLTGIDPPLSADDIEVQHQHLEDAIGEVESEFAAEDAVEDGAGEAPPPSAETPPQEPVDRAAQAPPEVPPAAPMPEPVAEEVAGGEAPAPSEEEPEPVAAQKDERARSSRAPMMIMLALIALMAVGAAALAYTQWETVETVYADLRDQYLGSGSGEVAEGPAEPPEQSVAEAPAEPPEPARPAVPKSDDRLLPGSDADGDPDAPRADDGAADGQDQAALDRPGDGGPGAATGTTLPSTDEPEIPAFDRPDPPAETGDREGAGLVAQRAIFYEQGEEGSSGKASQGAVAWERVERPQQPPAIEARIDLPEQDATINLTFTSNTDPGLPASHLIEIAIEGEGALGPGGIQRVPALVLKESEQARGQALAGAAVPVTERLYWIALSDDPDQIGRNLSLLRDGSWFDMPIMYENGERALLTFEKGIPGDRVFETVLAEWAEAQQSQR